MQNLVDIGVAKNLSGLGICAIIAATGFWPWNRLPPSPPWVQCLCIDEGIVYDLQGETEEELKAMDFESLFLYRPA